MSMPVLWSATCDLHPGLVYNHISLHETVSRLGAVTQCGHITIVRLLPTHLTEQGRFREAKHTSSNPTAYEESVILLRASHGL